VDVNAWPEINSRQAFYSMGMIPTKEIGSAQSNVFPEMSYQGEQQAI
jgi:hypothetical protein